MRPPSIAILLAALLSACPGASDSGPERPDDDDDSSLVDDDDSGEADDDDTAQSRDGDGDGYTENQGDCNDEDPAVHPGVAADGCDGVDNDCDGMVDEDPESVVGLPPGDWTSDDAFALLNDDSDEWALGAVLAGSAVQSTPFVAAHASRLDNGAVGEAGIATFGVPRCPGRLQIADHIGAFLVGSWTGFSPPRRVADFNGDSVADIFLQDRLYFGPFDGTIETSSADATLPFTPDDVDSFDLDGDGVNDLVAGDASQGVVAFWAGPLEGVSLSVNSASMVVGPPGGNFGASVAVLPRASGQPPVTLVGAPDMSPYGSLFFVEGAPASSAPVGEIALDSWQETGMSSRWASDLRTDRAGMGCVGHGVGGPAELVCGSFAQLVGSEPGIQFDVGAANGTAVDTAAGLVVSGNPSYVEPEIDPVLSGRVVVRSLEGEAWTFNCVSYADCSGTFGDGVTVFSDPATPSVVWVATRGLFGLYYFALDVSSR